MPIKNTLKKLLGIEPASSDPDVVPPYCPQGVRIYCIGDIHGRADLLLQLHVKVINDAATFTGSKKIIYLGDYIDRGERTRAVIDSLLNHPLPGFESVYLRGNHEQSMLDFLQHAEKGRGWGWLSYGGMAALLSYGVNVERIPSRQRDYLNVKNELMEKLPGSHLQFLQKTRLSHSCGSYYFVHAGVRPGIPLDQQVADDQLWIRDEFLSSPKYFEQIIVHGHTVTEKPEMHYNRIGIDTGAYLSGILTALVLEGETQRIIQTHA